MSDEITLPEMLALRARLDAERLDYVKQLAETPLGEKARIKELRAQVLACESQLRQTKPQLKHLQSQQERIETQYLWAAGVRTVCGQKALDLVYDWMKAEKRRREVNACPAITKEKTT